MTIGKLYKQYISTPICTYKMFEIHYSTKKDLKYTIKKYISGKVDKQLVMPVSHPIAEAVWKELEENDWKS